MATVGLLIQGDKQSLVELPELFWNIPFHDDVIKWKHFPRCWPFVRGIPRSPVNFVHKGQWCGALMFSLICALNKRLSKQSWCWWFETPSRSLWRHCNVAHGSMQEYLSQCAYSQYTHSGNNTFLMHIYTHTSFKSVPRVVTKVINGTKLYCYHSPVALELDKWPTETKRFPESWSKSPLITPVRLHTIFLVLCILYEFHLHWHP